ncbi:hypothetical protein MT391_20090 [Vibrio sp. 1-Bac 57]
MNIFLGLPGFSSPILQLQGVSPQLLQGSLGATLMVFAANSPFDERSQSYKFIHHFNPATNDTSHFLKAISENIHLLFDPSISYYKIGSGLLNLSSEAHQQWDLFTPPTENAR